MAWKVDDLLLTISYICSGEWNDIYDIIKNKKKVDSTRLIEARDNVKSQFIQILSDEYPDCYKHAHNPPILLYYYGDIKLLKTPLLAVVGSRHPTDYQKRMTEKILDAFFEKTKNEYGIISGLARGIDQIAMGVAMRHHAKSVGVLGSGIEYCYPKENKHIYDYCKEHGLLISEYPCDVKPLPEHFPFRNRLIASACRAMFVPGASQRSGTSTSIKYALEAGKDILALPCDLENNDLTDYLIHDGADVIINADDLIDAMDKK